MPDPKSGKPGTLVSPAAPSPAHDADKSDPGEVDQVKADQQQTQTGKYGSAKIKPYKPDPNKTSWIEIEMVNEDNEPVPGETYRITLPDGETVAEGTLDEKGFARVDGIDPGTCKITFPELDKSAWEAA